MVYIATYSLVTTRSFGSSSKLRLINKQEGIPGIPPLSILVMTVLLKYFDLQDNFASLLSYIEILEFSAIYIYIYIHPIFFCGDILFKDYNGTKDLISSWTLRNYSSGMHELA